ncbi:hypothetical protein CCP3SC1AL1_3550001 [Gammaproteobacteria bacterium]
MMYLLLAWVTGDTELKKIVCQNITTGQIVTMKGFKKSKGWDCTAAAGFLTRDGDTIKETLIGTFKTPPPPGSKYKVYDGNIIRSYAVEFTSS